MEIEEMLKKRTEYEKRLGDILNEFEKQIPSTFKIDSVVAVRSIGKNSPLTFNIKIELSDEFNKR